MTYIHFDYHANVRGGRTDALVSDLKDKIEQPITQFRYFHSSKANGVTEKQSGTVRTNCLDCLDRTNAVQTFIGLLVSTMTVIYTEIMQKGKYCHRKFFHGVDFGSRLRVGVRW